MSCKKQTFEVGKGVRWTDYRYGVVDRIDEENDYISVIDLSMYEGHRMDYKLSKFIELGWYIDETLIPNYKKQKEKERKREEVERWNAEHWKPKKLEMGIGEFLQARVDAFGNIID